MSDGISFFSNDDIEKHVQLVMRQTNYTEEEARNKLKLYNSDYLTVLKEYMGRLKKERIINFQMGLFFGHLLLVPKCIAVANGHKV